MTDRPILFSAPMVQAILDGRKTQTRRAVKPQPAGEIRRGEPDFNHWIDTKYWERQNQKENRGIGTRGFACTYGQPGDRLWVRETWMDLQGTGIEIVTGSRERYAYGADTPRGSYGDDQRKCYGLKWRPSIHMPRAASRITLEITSVRVERLQDISEAEALAEGIQRYAGPLRWVRYLDAITGEAVHSTARDAFFALWIALNGQPSFNANPLVWILQFKHLQEPRP